MRTKAPNILASALIALSAFFFVSFFLNAEEAKEEFVTQPLTVAVLLGEAEVLSKDTAIWRPVRVGDKLFEGDRIKTAEGAKAELLLEDGSFIRLREKTTLIIKTTRQKISTQATEHNLELRVGEIMLELKELNKGSTFEVQTPTAVAAVRGTTYYVRTGTMMVDGVEKSFVEIFVDAGLVDYTNIVSGTSCIVPGGQGAIVFDDGTIEGPYPVPPSAQDAWRSSYDMKYDDSQDKKGMRDEEEEGGDDDTGEDVDDTTDSQNESQDNANQERNNEQELYGLAKAGILTDTDGDGITDDIDDDDDNDNYTDIDETDNETDPLDAAETPPDNDTDYVSDLNDPDDDNDDLSDDDEPNYATNSFDADSDDDNLADGDEVAGRTPYNYVTNPAKADTDDDGFTDGHTSPADRFPLDNREQKDSDGDVPVYWNLLDRGAEETNLFMPDELYPGDFEDAFPDDSKLPLSEARKIHGDGIHTDEFGKNYYGWHFYDKDDNPVVVRGYGSWRQMREATLNNISNAILEQHGREAVADMIDDIHARGYEAAKENIFDHQAGKVMMDKWGNRVRVEEYVFKHPTNGVVDTVQILALNLRTAGPNAGISSYDFRVRFNRDIENTNLRTLDRDTYMDNPLVGEIDLVPTREPRSENGEQLTMENGDQLILYEYYPYAPYPVAFSLEVKNPYAESVKATEEYSSLGYGQIRDGCIKQVWYQFQTNDEIYINGALKQPLDKTSAGSWGKGWNNQVNRFTFLDYCTDDNENSGWLMGAFYLVNDDGSPVLRPAEGDDKDYLVDIRGLRDLINPDFNLEMVFLSSEFGDTPDNLPTTIAAPDVPYKGYASYDEYLNNTYRNIDVITIPEITTPYQ